MNIIKDYDTLPLGQHLAICEICERGAMSDEERQTAINAILAGLTEEEMLALPIMEYREVSAASRFLEEPVVPRRGIAKVYNLGPFALVAATDITKITAAQYIDFQTFAREGRQRLPEILSCLLVPKGKEYNEGYDVLQVHDAIRNHLSIRDAVTLSAFFLQRFETLIKATLIYSKLKATMMPKAMRKKTKEEADRLLHLLQTAGDGLTPCGLALIRPAKVGRTFIG